MPRGFALLRLSSLLVALLAVTGPTLAGPMITGSATQQADGSYLYQYTVANPAYNPSITPFNYALNDLIIIASGTTQSNFTQSKRLVSN
jgi:hypothetical protein